MRHLLLPALCASLLATLAACENSSAQSAGEVAGAAIAEAPRRCAHCGWIEAKRELGPQAGDADLPAVYEYTVRMADGSSSRFREEHSVHWRVGERLMYIAGETKLSRARSADSP